MLCSNCLKKIPEGEEVAKTSGYWKVNGWGTDMGMKFIVKNVP